VSSTPGTSSPRALSSLLALLQRGVVCGGDLEEMFRLYRRVFDIQGMVCGTLYSFDGGLTRCEDVPDDWQAAYTATAHQDVAPRWLAQAPPGSVCLASRLQGVGPDLEHEFRDVHGWKDCAVSFMNGSLGSFISMGCYRRGEPYTDEEQTLMSLLHPYVSAALGTQTALRAFDRPAGETFDEALARFEGHAFVTWPTLEITWSERARDLWLELLAEPATPALWSRVEEVLERVVARFVSQPFATRSVRVFRGVRAEIVAAPPAAGEARRFILLFVRDATGAKDEEPPILRLLGERQRAVAMGAARGRSLKQIAADLGISLETARTHLKNAYRRLGVDSRVELCALLELD
jgi:DNA-binding CsgD family transcriptional regulator